MQINLRITWEDEEEFLQEQWVGIKDVEELIEIFDLTQVNFLRYRTVAQLRAAEPAEAA